MTRKLYREYYRDFEEDGLKWREVHVTLSARGRAQIIIATQIGRVFFEYSRHHIATRRARGHTCKFSVPLDNETAVYWALQGLYQKDAQVLSDLKACLDQ